jgi:DNA-directed RNA polymerase subunit RPC12/RpoP
MSDAQPKPPRYVICHCQHCEGHIEFDANELVEKNSIVPCPHCGLKTKIFVPPSQTKKVRALTQPVLVSLVPSPKRTAPLTSTGAPDANKLNKPNPPERQERADPKQVAYLVYMGVPNANQLSKKEADELIKANPFLDGAKSLAEFAMLRSHQDRWPKERLILHPDLHASELKEFLRDDLPNSLHTYVRKQVVGASEILTKSEIQRVIDALNTENAHWWHRSNHQAFFFERLKQVYPGCCNGHTPNG